MLTIPITEYENAMRESVCGLCVSFAQDRNNPTRCGHETSGACTLFAHLPEVVEVVSTVESGSIEPYLTSLRHEVCANCTHQDNRGICDLRDNRGPSPAWCVLDSYYNIIVGTIEDVQKQYASND